MRTFIPAWGKFDATLDFVATMFRLPLVKDHGAKSIVLSEEEERALQLLDATLRVSNKSMYTR